MKVVMRTLLVDRFPLIASKLETIASCFQHPEGKLRFSGCTFWLDFENPPARLRWDHFSKVRDALVMDDESWDTILEILRSPHYSNDHVLEPARQSGLVRPLVRKWGSHRQLAVDNLLVLRRQVAWISNKNRHLLLRMGLRTHIPRVGRALETFSGYPAFFEEFPYEALLWLNRQAHGIRSHRRLDQILSSWPARTTCQRLKIPWTRGSRALYRRLSLSDAELDLTCESVLSVFRSKSLRLMLSRLKGEIGNNVLQMLTYGPGIVEERLIRQVHEEYQEAIAVPFAVSAQPPVNTPSFEIWRDTLQMLGQQNAEKAEMDRFLRIRSFRQVEVLHEQMVARQNRLAIDLSLSPEDRKMPFVIPVPGNEHVCPVKNADEVFEQSDRFNNCASIYATRCLDGVVLLYTVEIEKGYLLRLNRQGESWVVKELKGYGNSSPSPEAQAAVREWVEGAPVPVIIRSSDFHGFADVGFLGLEDERL